MVRSFQEIDPVAFTRAVRQGEGIGIARARLRRQHLPAIDQRAGAGDRRAVVEPGVQLRLIERPPVNIGCLRHGSVSRP